MGAVMSSAQTAKAISKARFKYRYVEDLCGTDGLRSIISEGSIWSHRSTSIVGFNDGTSQSTLGPTTLVTASTDLPAPTHTGPTNLARRSTRASTSDQTDSLSRRALPIVVLGPFQTCTSRRINSAIA